MHKWPPSLLSSCVGCVEAVFSHLLELLILSAIVRLHNWIMRCFFYPSSSFYIIFSLGVQVFWQHVCLCTMCVCVYSAQGPKEGMGSIETRVTDGCKLPRGCRGQTWCHWVISPALLHSVETGFHISQTGSLTSIPHCVDRPCLCPFSLSPAFPMARTLDFTV